MRSFKRAVQVLGILAAVVVSVAITAQVMGSRGMFARPTAVAVVNLSTVLEGLEQRAVAEADLMTQITRYCDEEGLTLIFVTHLLYLVLNYAEAVYALTAAGVQPLPTDSDELGSGLRAVYGRDFVVTSTGGLRFAGVGGEPG